MVDFLWDFDVSRSPIVMGTTFPETNIAPETGWLEYQFLFFGMAYFQIVQAFLLLVVTNN